MAPVKKSGIVSGSEKETIDLGARIGAGCRGGELIRLIGPLGAGTSVLVRGIARGMGVRSRVKSPSFNLMREYKGRLVLRHWDLFRLDGGFETLGLLESVEERAVVLVEWAERWGGLGKYATGTIYMEHGKEEMSRSIEWEGEIPGLTE